MSYLGVILFLTITCLGLPQQLDPNYTYEDFMRQFNRTYTGADKDHHKNIFQSEYSKILQLVKQGENIRINQFLDWNQTQKKQFFSIDLKQKSVPLSSPSLRATQVFSAPSSFDWKKYGKVTDVKDQGYCGSCWAYSANAVYESLYAIANQGKKVSLSQQYTMQCTGQTSIPCTGGVPFEALQLLNRTGAPLQQKYPYQGQDFQFFWTKDSVICNDLQSAVKINRPTVNIHHLENLTTKQIEQYLVSYGPLSVGVNGSNTIFQFAGPQQIKCLKQRSVDHAVLLYGYNQTHWFIKNSWGPFWGDGGFGYINKNNDCNLHTYVDVLQIDFGFNPSPSPTPNPPKPSDETIILQVTLFDSFGDGWNKNEIAIRQNGGYVAIFGKKFTSGYKYGPINITINAKEQSQIVVFKYGQYQNEIGFSIKYLNGSEIFSFNGSSYRPDRIFKTFCPTVCPIEDGTVTYYLTMSDKGGDGWNGNVLAFRQNGFIQNFSLASGYSNQKNPIPLKFSKFQRVDVIVHEIGSKIEEIGFSLKAQNGGQVFALKSGTYLEPNKIVGTFSPESVNYDLIQIDEGGIRKTNQGGSSSQNYVNGYEIAIYIIAPLLCILVIITILMCLKLKGVDVKYKKNGNLNMETMKTIESENKI